MSRSPRQSRSAGRPSIALLAGLLTAGVAGCGVGAGEQASGVHLRVSDGFGSRVLAEPAEPKQSGSDTVMRLLQRNAKVQTRYSGGFVQAIDGLSGEAASRQIDWFYYVNGVLADRGAAAWRVREGERIWWDRHRWDLAQISAVVGDFPQPMKDGSGGKYAGAQLDCRAADELCDAARERLEDAGVKVTVGPASAAGGRTRVVVGPWERIKNAAPEVQQLAGGPAVSGVFAKVAADGGIVPLDEAGKTVVQIDNVGDTLVAALRTGDASPVWVVTGRDTGLDAVHALDAKVLSGRAAVLVQGDAARALPLRAADPGRKLSP
jgi:Domain of unknown function (DUF4430)